MMKILAIIIPASNRHDASSIYFPLGMAYILGSIRDKYPGAVLKLLDLNMERRCSREEYLPKCIIKYKEFKPDYILYGGMVTRYRFVNKINMICRLIFNDSVQIVGGSIAATAYKQLLFHSSVDLLVIGEGEETIVEVLGGVDYGEIDGIAYKASDGSICINATRKRIGKLDALPMPAYDLFDTEVYIESNYKRSGWRYLPLICSRGCPFRCNFCYINFGSKMAYRSPGLVVEELKFLKEKYNINSFILWDEIQFLNKEWMRCFAEELMKSQLNLKYSVVSRVTLFRKLNRVDDLNLFRLCKKSGLLRINVGIESGCQRILDAMNKKSTVEQIEYALRLIREAEIKATGSMLLGYPGETHQSIRESIAFANRNLLKTSFYSLIPMPGTKLYEYCVDNKLIANEDEYLERISEHGDASHIYINLTELSDDDYRKITKIANKLVSKVSMVSILKYYGIKEGIKQIMLEVIRDVNRKIHGRIFETP